MIRLTLAAALIASFAGLALAAGPRGSAGKDRVFEMRTYHALEGRGPALHKRFREHTCELFKKHGMELIGFWTPIDEKEGKADKLVYILAYPSKAAADKSWKAFQADPEWVKARDASEADGKIVKKVDSVYLNPTDYSPVK